MIREYQSSAHLVDRNIERLVKFLESNFLMENTIIIFISDHGYMSGHNGLWHKARGWWMTLNGKDPNGIYGFNRINLFYNSLRVSWIVYWPDKIRKSIVAEEVITFVDWFPTLLSIAKISPLKDLLLRDRNFLLLLSKEKLDCKNEIYAEFLKLIMIQTKKLKLILYFYENQIHELFDLKNDKNETINIFIIRNKELEIIRENLLKKLKYKMDKVKDPLIFRLNI